MISSRPNVDQALHQALKMATDRLADLSVILADVRDDIAAMTPIEFATNHQAIVAFLDEMAEQAVAKV